MGRNKKIEDIEIKERNIDDAEGLVDYTVIDEKMALPLGYIIKLKKSVAKQFIEKGYLK